MSSKISALKCNQSGHYSNWVAWQMIESWFESWFERAEANLRQLRKTDRAFHCSAYRTNVAAEDRGLPLLIHHIRKKNLPFYFLLKGDMPLISQRISRSTEHDMEDFVICYSNENTVWVCVCVCHCILFYYCTSILMNLQTSSIPSHTKRLFWYKLPNGPL